YINRFISADTIVPNPADPQSYNRYSYVLNRPLNLIDPTGHWYYDPGCDCLVDTGNPGNEHPGNLSIPHAGLTTDDNCSPGCWLDEWHGGVTKVSGTADEFMFIFGLLSGGKVVAEGIDTAYGCLTGGFNGCIASLGLNQLGSLAGSALRGANWNRLGEVIDASVIKQLFPDSCSSACGQMLLSRHGINASQEAIIDLVGRPTSVDALANGLNQLETGSGRWVSGGFNNTHDAVAGLNSTGPWMANMRVSGQSVQHSVVVSGYDNLGNLLINDPWLGTSYTMTVNDFLSSWGGYGVYYRP
ncbi:MAG TPA: papain-like cysteine protease family protein, partial [Chloroflexota bacterium]|nr:papain-like cysteine protease family protein [Chloroflexota bacterium]HUM69540.1 papain-like cysteine protease family protein [Chloroflexota bacterium]